MFPVQYNHPTITGYSICWNGRILTIHAHKADEDLAFYTPTTPSQERATWVYVPLDPGDSVAEVWRRSGTLDKELAVLFKTSRGRLLLLGPQQGQSWGPFYTWTLLDQPEAKPGTIWYDETGQFWAFETPRPPRQSPPLLPAAPSPFPGYCPMQSYFYSSAILDDAAEVSFCRPPMQNKVSGMLFRYADGRKACVGEIRLDCMDLPVPLSKLMVLWLEFVWDHGIFVRSVRFSRPLKESTSQWFKVPICGRLEWWFVWTDCKIYHAGQGSPLPRPPRLVS